MKGKCTLTNYGDTVCCLALKQPAMTGFSKHHSFTGDSIENRASAANQETVFFSGNQAASMKE